MKLFKIEIEGFKRFKEKIELNIEGKLISIIGANEAGKSSILKALIHMNHGDAFEHSGIHSEISVNKEFNNDHEVVKCYSILTEEDRKLLAHIPEAKNINYYINSKMKNGGGQFEISPRIYRDITLRRLVLKRFNKALNNGKSELSSKFINYIENIIGKNEFLKNEDSVLKTLKLSQETLEPDALGILLSTRDILVDIINESFPKYVQQLPELFTSLIDCESKTNPEDQALEILSEMEPKFLLFGEKDRMLLSSYDLNNINHINDIALLNLLTSAEIDIQQLKKNVQALNYGKVEVIIESGNAKLKEEFKAWTQSNNYPKIIIHEMTLTIQAGNIEQKEYHNIVQRSEGFQQFVALFSFIKKNEATSSILLIDEADIHLHYDAQADFIQMLAKQSLVDKVIYTTHSIGCLPEDIGSGIRLVKYNEEKRTSEVVNWFWSDNIPGFSSVLYGLGATTLAFIPVRYALFVEGATDYILLPTLFKEVIDRDYLGFMITPGISVANEEQIQIANLEHPKSLYLIDSDHGQKSLYSMLVKARIPEKHIFSLPKKENQGLAIEDLLVKETYLEALNLVIKKYDCSVLGLDIKDIPNFDRTNKISAICKDKKYPLPSKRDVSHQLIDLHSLGKPLVSKNYKNKLVVLFNQIDKVFHS